MFLGLWGPHYKTRQTNSRNRVLLRGSQSERSGGAKREASGRWLTAQPRPCHWAPTAGPPGSAADRTWGWCQVPVPPRCVPVLVEYLLLPCDSVCSFCATMFCVCVSYCTVLRGGVTSQGWALSLSPHTPLPPDCISALVSLSLVCMSWSIAM